MRPIEGRLDRLRTPEAPTGRGGARLRARAAIRLAAAGVLVAIVLSACSGGGSGADEGASARAGSSTTVPTSSPSTAAGGSPVASLRPCPGTGVVADEDIVYREIEGVDPNLLSLDVYEPERSPDCPPAPVMVFVHGGAWAHGDKSNNVDDKVSWFTGRGWVLVSVNYRLSPAEVPDDPADLDPDRVMHPDHARDVAAAVAWVREHAGEYGGDPDATFLMGHSAGAHLVSLVSTDASLLGDQGLDLAAIRCTVSLDNPVWDLRARSDDSQLRTVKTSAFGTDPAVWADASPMVHVGEGGDVPDFLVVTRNRPSRVEENREFADAVHDAGAEAEVLVAGDLNHSQINRSVGAPGDSVVTPVLGRFLDGCLGG